MYLSLDRLSVVILKVAFESNILNFLHTFLLLLRFLIIIFRIQTNNDEQ